jgi:hypothetical protein
MGAVHVGVRHDDDFVIPGFGGIEATHRFIALADPRATGRDQRPDFLVGKHLIEPRFLRVNKFSAQRQDGLEATVAALLGRAAGGVTLDDIKFCEGGIAFGAIGEFAGETAAGKCALPDRLTRFAGGLASAGTVERLIDNLFRDSGIRAEIKH